MRSVHAGGKVSETDHLSTIACSPLKADTVITCTIRPASSHGPSGASTQHFVPAHFVERGETMVARMPSVCHSDIGDTIG
jgi:hypothetical protein